ncbi:hypothetical protein SDC9_79725 [bioreactor metagenome]|uniref:Uncharacterized protein n=1 Tax=bioreactor metagenome TaxID=1076179 RepID=A0A644YX92_9ZZZZ
MRYVIVIKSGEDFKKSGRRLKSDRAVRRIADCLRCFFHKSEIIDGTFSVENFLGKLIQYIQPDAAGHALSAALRKAHTDIRSGELDRTSSPRREFSSLD